MPPLLNNPAHWQLRAQEARRTATQLEDPEAKAAVLKIANEYDRLAVRAAERLKTFQPVSIESQGERREAR